MFEETVVQTSISDLRAQGKEALRTGTDTVIGFLFWFNVPNMLFDRDKYNTEVQSRTYDRDPTVDFNIKKTLTIGEPRDYDAFRTGTRKAGTISENDQRVSFKIDDIVRPGEDPDGNGYERWLLRKHRDPAGRTKSEPQVARLVYDPARTPNDRLVIYQTDMSSEVTDICDAIRAAYIAELAGSSTERFSSAVKRCMAMLQPVTLDAAHRNHFCHPQYAMLVRSLEGLVTWVGKNFKAGVSTIEAAEFTVLSLYNTPDHREKAHAAVQRGLTRESSELVERMNALEKNTAGLEESALFRNMNGIKTEVKSLRKKATLYSAELKDTASLVADNLEIVVAAYERMLGSD